MVSMSQLLCLFALPLWLTGAAPPRILDSNEEGDITDLLNNLLIDDGASRDNRAICRNFYQWREGDNPKNRYVYAMAFRLTSAGQKAQLRSAVEDLFAYFRSVYGFVPEMVMDNRNIADEDDLYWIMFKYAIVGQFRGDIFESELQRRYGIECPREFRPLYFTEKEAEPGVNCPICHHPGTSAWYDGFRGNWGYINCPKKHEVHALCIEKYSVSDTTVCPVCKEEMQMQGDNLIEPPVDGQIQPYGHQIQPYGHQGYIQYQLPPFREWLGMPDRRVAEVD